MHVYALQQILLRLVSTTAFNSSMARDECVGAGDLPLSTSSASRRLRVLWMWCLDLTCMDVGWSWSGQNRMMPWMTFVQKQLQSFMQMSDMSLSNVICHSPFNTATRDKNWFAFHSMCISTLMAMGLSLRGVSFLQNWVRQ